MRFLILRDVLPRFGMLLLELAGVVLIFGVALPVAVGAIRVAAGAVDVAEAALAKAGIVAAIGKTAVAKARTAAGKASPVECAATVKASEATTKGYGALSPDRDAHGDRRARQQRSGQPLSANELPRHRYPPGATWRP